VCCAQILFNAYFTYHSKSLGEKAKERMPLKGVGTLEWLEVAFFPWQIKGNKERWPIWK
jgi:hypothetical protein